MQLIIGSKRTSSWSLRPWVLMTHFQIPFEEKIIELYKPETRVEILKYSQSGQVPALIDNDLVVWDSLAIVEYLNEKFPEKQMWPKDFKQRAHARAITNEMHGGFTQMRQLMSHDIQKKLDSFDRSLAQANIDRIEQIWDECLQKYGGPYLFGSFSIADAFYAPVANRFISYGVPLKGNTKKYVETIRSLPAHAQWIEQGMNER